MSTDKHTPGPWKLYKKGVHQWPGIEAFPKGGKPVTIVIFGNAGEECGVRGGGVEGGTHEKALANAHLIAAAPEMLEALREMYAAWRQMFSALDRFGESIAANYGQPLVPIPMDEMMAVADAKARFCGIDGTAHAVISKAEGRS